MEPLWGSFKLVTVCPKVENACKKLGVYHCQFSTVRKSSGKMGTHLTMNLDVKTSFGMREVFKQCDDCNFSQEVGLNKALTLLLQFSLSLAP